MIGDDLVIVEGLIGISPKYGPLHLPPDIFASPPPVDLRNTRARTRNIFFFFFFRIIPM